LKKHWATSKEFTLAVANAMPEAYYGFKPAHQEWSFGQTIGFIAGVNGYYCSSVVGETSPIQGPLRGDKASAIKVLTKSFDYCAEVVSRLGPADLEKPRTEQQLTVRELLWSGFTSIAHHRAQLEVYLKLKGIKPPDYRF